MRFHPHIQYNHIYNQDIQLIKKESDVASYDTRSMIEIVELRSYIESLEKNALLRDEKKFDQRMEAIDFIEFQIIDQIEDLVKRTDQVDELIFLKHRVEKIKSELEEINTNLFQKLRTKIRAGRYAGKEFKNLINEYFDVNLVYEEHVEEPGYDDLDIFINGLFFFQTVPDQTKDLEPEMIYFQKTPARIVFEQIKKSHFHKDDIFFDIGSGLGQVAILVNMLAGIEVRGIEFEPAFCDYARDCARELNLSNIQFINVDARKADYTNGTIFFMYTPFKGEMLQEVLAMLRKESLARKITIITYGPCTTEVALQSWLTSAAPNHNNIYELGFFSSF